MHRMKASCFEQSKTMSGGWPWPWPCLAVCYMLAVPSRNEGHTQPSKACPAIEQCKQLRYVCGAWLMGQCRNCLGLSICMSLKKTSVLERKGEEAEVQESPATAADGLVLCALCSGSGWPPVQEKCGVEVIRGRERSWARTALHCAPAVSEGQ